VRRTAVTEQAQDHQAAAAAKDQDELDGGDRPRAAKKESAYFANDELPHLFDKFADGVYRTLFLVALKTGMRQGELLALTWGDIDLSATVIRVRRTYTDGHLGTPKNHERRDVDLTSDLVDLLGSWWGEGTEWIFEWRSGRLEARRPGPKPPVPATFDRETEDRYRTVSGREHGELLLITRDEDGTPTKLSWATYAFTRSPAQFGR